ncbi:MAG: penicillin-binding transpeptidase domain-containing protein [Verrucomicrobiota bacterium]
MSFYRCLSRVAVLLGLAGSVCAQTEPVSTEAPDEKKKIGASWETRTEARTVTLKIPAPRGQIVDRNGIPFAQNRVAYQLALRLPYEEESPVSFVVRYAQERVNYANRVLGTDFTVEDAVIEKHYQNRRWLPLPYSPVLNGAQVELMRERLSRGIVLFPTYVRHYGTGPTAGHVIGYAGTRQKAPKGPLTNGEPLFFTSEGKSGLEKSFDAMLRGKDGEISMLFDTDGAKLSEEVTVRPVQGDNVVTTLDIDMQSYAEQLLRNGGRNGAFVVMDVRNGDVLTLASWPCFDPNEFIPFITNERYAELRDDPGLPLYPRAYLGNYPPASTFKIPVALAALEAGIVDEFTEFGCPSGMTIDDRWFPNWNKKGEGSMNVKQAIMRSCNTWFYTAGLRTGGDTIAGMATRLGMGAQTGLPLDAEEDGFIPTVERLRAKTGRSLKGGYLANAAIGQGDVLATPIQVARMMAAIGNGVTVPRARLVLQVQDIYNNVVQAYPAEEFSRSGLNPQQLSLVRKGMTAVVNSGAGTGKQAWNRYVTLAGKTGTGQWTQAEDGSWRYIAWFAGYVPVESPEYAFAVIVEGNGSEVLSGGRNAAPLVGDFFNHVYSKKKEEGELETYAKGEIEEVPRGVGVGADAEYGDEAAESLPAATQPITELGNKPRRSLLDRIRRR